MGKKKTAQYSAGRRGPYQMAYSPHPVRSRYARSDALPVRVGENAGGALHLRTVFQTMINLEEYDLDRCPNSYFVRAIVNYSGSRPPNWTRRALQDRIGELAMPKITDPNVLAILRIPTSSAHCHAPRAGTIDPARWHEAALILPPCVCDDCRGKARRAIRPGRDGHRHPAWPPPAKLAAMPGMAGTGNPGAMPGMHGDGQHDRSRPAGQRPAVAGNAP